MGNGTLFLITGSSLSADFTVHTYTDACTSNYKYPDIKINVDFPPKSTLNHALFDDQSLYGFKLWQRS